MKEIPKFNQKILQMLRIRQTSLNMSDESFASYRRARFVSDEYLHSVEQGEEVGLFQMGLIAKVLGVWIDEILDIKESC
ncbi:hypothetical protein A6770_19380 [Nostoc minutum NIES-26]|uniref:HTH cro/C1-type domain-containing protein n=1 Tax=Nostoc minutum NIES-26 TaxID=1844469 RepID=A0A367R692_9NOSO|nr:hypothetical protein [Dendronalium sp. ChiSLP03b]MDZ8206636.1 hypothetical protein [Dendronalium sp. ChiSLP03b]RCJ32008.1 hypothetical protein A6770_19380 [Nostoc minutum NIES-26]